MYCGQHISDFSSKATKTLGFLRRNLTFIPRSTKEVVYTNLVRPKLKYAAPIWSQYCKTQIQQVEKVQRTATRWTSRRWRNTSSVGEMLDERQWPTLEVRIDQSSLPFFHKNLCGIMSFDKDKYLVAGQLGLKSCRPLSRLVPGSTRPESTWPSVFSEHSATYMTYGLFCIIFWAESRINI